MRIIGQPSGRILLGYDLGNSFIEVSLTSGRLELGLSCQREPVFGRDLSFISRHSSILRIGDESRPRFVTVRRQSESVLLTSLFYFHGFCDTRTTSVSELGVSEGRTSRGLWSHDTFLGLISVHLYSVLARSRRLCR